MTRELLFEAMEHIDPHYIAEAEENIKTKTPQMRYRHLRHRGALAACLCLVVGIGIAGISRRYTTSPPSLMPAIEVNPMTASNIDAQIEYYIEAPTELVIGLSRSQKTAEEWQTFYAQFEENTGMSYDIVTAKIPDWLGDITALYTLYTRESFPDGEYTIHDYVFHFDTDTFNVRMAMSHKGKPMRDCFYGGGNKQSHIADTAVTVYGNEDFYYAEFEKNGVFYDIEVYNLTLKQLTDLLYGLVS